MSVSNLYLEVSVCFTHLMTSFSPSHACIHLMKFFPLTHTVFLRLCVYLCAWVSVTLHVNVSCVLSGCAFGLGGATSSSPSVIIIRSRTLNQCEKMHTASLCLRLAVGATTSTSSDLQCIIISCEFCPQSTRVQPTDTVGKSNSSVSERACGFSPLS